MLTIKSSFLSLLTLLFLLSAAVAQDEKITSPTKDSSIVTASVNGERLRFTAPPSVVQIRLEVYSSIGNKIFDKDVRGGNVLDWLLQDAQAQPLADDAYLCVLTIKSLSGNVRQSLGAVKVEKNSASLQPLDPTQITAQQAQTVGPTEEYISLTMLKEDERQTTTLIAHNGEEGQITRGQGALSFRLGDFYSGRNVEQMTLTAEGNLGIGITHPQVRLDVDGLIRATQGIIFPDGTVQYSAASKTLGAKSSRAGQMPDGKKDVEPQSITATQGRIAKFVDGSGTLGDSIITETAGGFLGIGTPSPDSLLNIQGPVPSLLGHMSVIRTTGSNNGFGLLMDAIGSGNNNLGLAVGGAPKASFSWDNTRNFLGFANLNYSPNDFSLRVNANGSLTYHNGASSAELFRITDTGNVGIGATNPSTKLEVGGNALIYPTSGPGSMHIRNRTISDYSQVVFDDNNNAYRGYIGYIGANAGLGARNDTVEFGTQGTNMTFRPNEAEVMRLTTTGRVGIGTPAPSFRLHVIDGSNTGLRVQTNATGGTVASFGVNGDFQIDAPGIVGGRFIVKESGNIGIGTPSPVGNLHLNVPSSANPINALTIDVQSFQTPGNAVASHYFKVRDVGSGSDPAFLIRGDGNVGIGTGAPSYKLTLIDPLNTGLRVQTNSSGGTVASFASNGEFQIDSPGIAGGRLTVREDGTVLINDPSSGITNGLPSLIVNGTITAAFPVTSPPIGMCHDSIGRIGECVSSIRYKKNVNDYLAGLNLIRRLRPVSFNWKQGGEPDMGLIAEEVADAEPLLVTHDSKGEILGVKYDRVGVVLINAFKGQQTQLEQYRAQLERQQAEIAALKRLVCKTRRHSKACK